MSLDDDPSFESMLQNVKRREPGERLDRRVNAVFADHRDQSPSFTAFRIGYHRLAIAAGLLLMIGIGIRLSRPKPPAAVAIITPPSPPIEIETDTSSVIDDGIIARTDNAVFEQHRRRTVREIWYEDPGTHVKWQMTIPTEQVVIEKVEAY